MNITVNGAARGCAADTTVADLAAQLGVGQRGSAVAVNGEVVPRARWGERQLAEGDRIDVVTAVQGG